jgi:alkanesulfonate monooxygenase SsuD/methylene tetrahydromethanopterin reductase-like flavin-dependent oxidoreductase (luciferase family)
LKLSVLDQSASVKGILQTLFLQNTVKLAQLTEDLGYTRFWVAEHLMSLFKIMVQLKNKNK